MEREKDRNIAIDLLRAVAILAVMADHWVLSGLSAPGSGPWDEVLRRIGGHGFYGVTLFFVLSGFLITRTTMLRELAFYRLSWRDFYVRRIARIQPLFLLAVALGVLMLAFGDRAAPLFAQVYADPRSSFTVEFWASLFTFTNNWERVFHDGFWGLHWDVMWSLAVEEQFYLAFPLLVLWAGLRRRLAGALAAVAVIGLVARIAGDALHLGFTAKDMNSFVCFDTLALGCLCALLGEVLPHGRGLARAAIAAGALLIALALYRGGVAALIAGALLAVHGARYADPFSGAVWRGIARIGQLSYGMYLLHATALYFAAPILAGLPPLAGFALFAAATYAIAELSYRAYEAPLNAWLRARLLPQGALRPGASLSEAAS